MLVELFQPFVDSYATMTRRSAIVIYA